MKIHYFIEDTHLPPKISKCISSHLITRTANEKPREQNLRILQSVMILVVRLGQLTDIAVKLLGLIVHKWGHQDDTKRRIRVPLTCNTFFHFNAIYTMDILKWKVKYLTE
jgi:hypothetical protein